MHQSSWIKSSWINGFNGNPMGNTRTARWSPFRLRCRLRLGQATCGIALTSAMSLASVMSLAGLAGTVAAGLIMAPSVYAYTTEDVLSVSWETGEDYNALVRRAENAARTSAQQQFDSDILLTRVIITVLGENGSDTVPILRLDVVREDWRKRPDPQYWATYYRTSRALLNLDQSAPAARTPQPVTPVPAPPAQAPNSAPDAAPASPARPNQPGSPNAAPGGAGSNPVNPVPISIPATPAGETGLPRSILR